MSGAPDKSMPRKTLVSIGMPVFNCARTVAQSICSIQLQTFEDWELLIIDDGSTDDTFRVASEVSDARIQVIDGGVNRGLPARLNQTVALAKGDYFARMDGDDVCYPNRLRLQTDYLEKHPEIDLLGASMVIFRAQGQAYGGRTAVTSHHEICARPWSGIRMAHPTWMGRTEWFRSNPYCEDAIRMEDKDLLFRTHRQSKFANLPDYLLGYRENEVSLRKILPSRKNTCKMLIAHAGENLSYFETATGLVGQIVRASADVVAVVSGLNEKLLRHRARPLSLEIVDEWNHVWAQTSSTPGLTSKDSLRTTLPVAVS